MFVDTTGTPPGGAGTNASEVGGVPLGQGGGRVGAAASLG